MADPLAGRHDRPRIVRLGVIDGKRLPLAGVVLALSSRTEKVRPEGVRPMVRLTQPREQVDTGLMPVLVGQTVAAWAQPRCLLSLPFAGLPVEQVNEERWHVQEPLRTGLRLFPVEPPVRVLIELLSQMEAGIYRFGGESDCLSPPQPQPVFRGEENELVRAPGQERSPFRDEERAERVGDLLVSGFALPSALRGDPSAAALGDGRVAVNDALVYSIPEDGDELAHDALDGAVGVGREEFALPCGDGGVGVSEVGHLPVAPLANEVVADDRQVVAHGGGLKINAGVPFLGPVAEGELVNIAAGAAPSCGGFLFLGVSLGF